MTGSPEALLEVRSEGSARKVIFSRARIAVVTDSLDGGEELARALQDAETETHGAVGLVTFWLSCPGSWLDEGREISAAQLFAIDVGAWTQSPDVVTLHTYSDAWLSHNLRGYPQPEVQAANASRLSDALRTVSEFTGDEVDPGDPTWYATPTPSGFEALPDEDPELLDSWDMFEVPYRYKRLRSALPDGAGGYEEEAESSVHYVPVAKGERVLGYLWASDADDAAGFEPRSASGDAAFDAGAFWLQRLGDAKARGLSPTEALRELSAGSDVEAGHVIPGMEADIASLDELRDLAGRA
ncbi:hypothetical protein ACMATS_16640 [Streptoverticillium reticulum]|uniref:hypothetical protein n=1 Tax=Streptoverticillium reticulum TaxID=1433415 RepID=UPI0039BF897E